MPSPAKPFHAAAALFALALLAGCAGREPDSAAPAPQPQVEQPVTRTEQDQLRQQAQRGDLDSQFQLGSSYFVGQPEKNLKQAEYWWKQAADKGHAMAAVSLAYLYTGRDAPEFANQQGMLKYLNQSAAAGNPMAQHVLGNLYRRGEGGVPRDPDQAQRLYQSACRQRYEPSCAALGGQ
ncbi:tetratricopeptide repeat protein [Ectopseudomonas guguanensis]|jgi:TPR repeat protein|uniref:tetratricopeptide repeat protein n=1 Tax=Ectopseudomonas guguanensis TaxID=1198456 RepID=UPI0028A77F7E|nr:tetratricopeptide repeat protein [Pseudomonas guguanensis]